MSAPTPVSSLVHSSTLVVAGVYLFIAYEVVMSSIICSMLLSGASTNFVGGAFALVEKDVKKIVALSTLSQLGFICIALGVSFAMLSFLHLITHALFKSCMFIQVGGFIRSGFALQDCRGYSNASVNRLILLIILSICVLSLCGLLFTRGFTSKDLIIGCMLHMQNAFVLALLFAIRILFTLFYSVHMMQAVACVRSNQSSNNGMNKAMMVWSFPVVAGGVIWGLVVVQSSINIPLSFSSFDKGLPVYSFIFAVLCLSKFTHLDGSSRRIIGQDMIAHSTQQVSMLYTIATSEAAMQSTSESLMKQAWLHGFDFVLLTFCVLLFCCVTCCVRNGIITAMQIWWIQLIWDASGIR